MNQIVTIAVAQIEMASTAKETGRSLSSMNQISNHLSRAMQVTAQTGDDLRKLTSNLGREVDTFRVAEQDASSGGAFLAQPDWASKISTLRSGFAWVMACFVFLVSLLAAPRSVSAQQLASVALPLIGTHAGQESDYLHGNATVLPGFPHKDAEQLTPDLAIDLFKLFLITNLHTRTPIAPCELRLSSRPERI